MFPSFSNGQRKRDIIRKLEEDMSLLHLQVRACKANRSSRNQNCSTVRLGIAQPGYHSADKQHATDMQQSADQLECM
jgi:hypothetical protein